MDYTDADVSDGHYSVVCGLDDKNIYLQDPEIGSMRKLDREDFMTVWFDFTGIKNIGMNRLYKGCGDYDALSMQDYQEIFEILHKVRIEYNLPVNFIDSFPRCLVPVKYWKYMVYCSQGIAFAQINYLGEVKNCASLSVGIGNIFKENLRVIWEEKLTKFRKLQHLPLSCRLCPIFCGGGCIATRTMERNFVADEFLKLPQKESFMEAISVTMENYFKKWFFQIITKLSKTKERGNHRSIEDCPRIIHKYKIRQENKELYVGMFENKGMLFLDQTAINVLRLLDGRHSLREISKATNISVKEVENIINMLIH